jgi:hypothetical protein
LGEPPPMWTTANRARHDRNHLRYPSDLTDAEWALIEPCIPPAKSGERRAGALLSPLTRASFHKPPTYLRFRGRPEGQVDVVECPSLIQTRPLPGSARIALSIVVWRQFNRTLDPDCEAFNLFKGNARWSRLSRGIARLDLEVRPVREWHWICVFQSFSASAQLEIGRAVRR